MTTLFLIRHAVYEHLGRVLVGHTPGIVLSAAGQQQAMMLAQRMASLRIGAVYSSPLERARQTAAPLAEMFQQEVRICEALTDIDYGDWTGCTVEQLAEDTAWHEWNTRRSAARIPGGETMAGAQTRTLSGLASICGEHAGSSVAIISHGDVIRSALAHYMDLSLDRLQRMEVRPASVSIVIPDEYEPRVLCVNHTGGLDTYGL